MGKNIGPEDRVVRIVAAIVLAVLIFVGAIEDLGVVIAGVLAAYLLVTAIIRTCLIYKLIGMDTSVQEQPYSTTDDRAF
jgi:hypothetical protein